MIPLGDNCDDGTSVTWRERAHHTKASRSTRHGVWYEVGTVIQGSEHTLSSCIIYRLEWVEFGVKHRRRKMTKSMKHHTPFSSIELTLLGHSAAS